MKYACILPALCYWAAPDNTLRLQDLHHSLIIITSFFTFFKEYLLEISMSFTVKISMSFTAKSKLMRILISNDSWNYIG